MPAIGERLREARTRRKLDIGAVEVATKIRGKYLRALENEEFELLPGPTFVKTFLRTYAEYLGLDAQLLVEEYRARYEPRAGDVQPFVPAGARRDRAPRPRSPRGPPGPGTALLVAVGVILVIFVILGVTNGSKPSSAPAPTSTRQALRPPPPAHRPTAPPAPITVVLRVVPAAPTYVCVDRGRGTPHAFEGTINQPMTFRGRHLRINAGIASVGLFANGRRVPIPVSPQPVGYDFTPRQVTPLAPALRPCIGA